MRIEGRTDGQTDGYDEANSPLFAILKTRLNITRRMEQRGKKYVDIDSVYRTILFMTDNCTRRLHQNWHQENEIQNCEWLTVVIAVHSGSTVSVARHRLPES
jgi:hypothetical protein